MGELGDICGMLCGGIIVLVLVIFLLTGGIDR